MVRSRTRGSGGHPGLAVDRLVEEAGTVVAVGDGDATHKSGDVHRFAFCDVFTFAGDEISRSSPTSCRCGDARVARRMFARWTITAISMS